MAAFDEEYTKWTAKNVGDNGRIGEWLLRLGTAAIVIGFLVAVLYGLSGSAELASARDGHLAEALRLSETAPQR
jgi:hypothetical protein